MKKPNFTIEQKIKMLNSAKRKLTKYHKEHNNISLALCLILRDLIMKNGGDYLLTYDIQKMFDMEIVKPDNIKKRESLGGISGYWWKFTNGGYLSRHKALNTLIKHFNEKL